MGQMYRSIGQQQSRSTAMTNAELRTFITTVVETIDEEINNGPIPAVALTRAAEQAGLCSADEADQCLTEMAECGCIGRVNGSLVKGYYFDCYKRAIKTNVN